MKKLFTLQKISTLFVGASILLLFDGGLFAQSGKGSSIDKSVASDNNSSLTTANTNEAQEHREKLASKWLDGLSEIKQKANASDANFRLFTNFYQSYLDSEKCALYRLIQLGQINDVNISEYMANKKQKLQAMYSNFTQIENEYGSSIQNNQGTHNFTPNAIACNPGCTNIDFSAGNFIGWNGYYGVNSSPTNKFDITSITGGPLGAVAKGAHDPNTNTYQVHITSKAHNDWFLSTYHGIAMSQASPFGTSNFAAMIGDSTATDYGVGILSQQFQVTAANDNLTYDYAILLENPNHTYYQQPLFTIAVLDQNGDTIPNCGDYKVVSGTKLKGFKGEYYPVEGDTVYWKNWTRVNVPLTRYIGQCVTIVFQVTDCALGAHFGYAYVDATCSHLQITASPVICGNSEIISAPAGEARYKWIGPSPGSIVGSDTIQNITVTAPGTYSVVLTPFTGALCNDTLTTTLTQDKLSLSTASANLPCYGVNTGSIIAAASNGILPYTYSWAGVSGNTTDTATGLSAGTYVVSVADSNGCSVSSTIIITQPNILNVSATTTANVSCNGLSNGSASSIVSGGTLPYAYSWTGGAGNSDTATGLSAGIYTLTVTDNNGCFTSASVTITQPGTLSVSAITSANVTCNGLSNGSAASSIIGGTLPYTYSWAGGAGNSDTATGLSAGIYILSVTDNNGCSASASTIITQPNILVVSAVTTANVSCNGLSNGSASSTVNGGTSPYTYSWTGGAGNSATANGLAIGTYTLNVTDNNGCSASASVTITQPATLSVSAVTTANVSCDGLSNGSASSSVSGGTLPYTYLWTGGAGNNANANGLIAGTYTLSVIDNNGCSASASVTITQPAILSVSAVTTANVTCNGLNNGSASSSVSGGTLPYAYSWTGGAGNNSSANGLTAGTYTLTVTDNNGCSTFTSITITQPNVLAASASVQANVSCNGGNNGSGSISASGGTTPYYYTWSNGATTASISGLTVGGYTVIVTDVHGCNTVTSITISQPTLLTASASVLVNISCNGSNNGSAKVNASNGTPAYTYKWSNGATTSSISLLAVGAYTATVTDAHGCTAVATVTITQPSALTTTITQTNVGCNGINNGSAQAIVAGGTLPYAYKWSNGVTTSSISSLTAGTYTVTVTDSHGCISITTVNITQPNPISLSTSSVNVNNCGDRNGSVTVSASGGTAPYTYKWSSNAGSKTTATVTGLVSGVYTVSVTDKNGCSATASATVYTKNFDYLEDVLCDDIDINGNNKSETSATVIFVSGLLCNTTYSWAPSGGTNATATNLTNGTYTCTITSCEGCIYQVIVDIDCFQFPDSHNKTNEEDNSTTAITSNISFYPNPTQGEYTIAGLGQGMRVETYTYLGQLLSTYTTGPEETKQFNITSQPNGIYLIRILNQDGSLVKQMKLVKTQ